MKEYEGVERLHINRHESKVEFINTSNSKVGEMRLYRTRFNLGDISNVDITAKDTKDSMHLDIRFDTPMKCVVTRDAEGYTVIKCEKEKEEKEEPNEEFEYEKPPSLSRLMRDAERWG